MTIGAESFYQRRLWEQYGGRREVSLAWGRADLITEDYVFEVEPYSRWTHGVRQVLAYSVQCERPPAIALYGPASKSQVLRSYLRLRDSKPAIALFWFSHGADTWCSVSSRRACRAFDDGPPGPSMPVGVVNLKVGPNRYVTLYDNRPRDR